MRGPLSLPAIGVCILAAALLLGLAGSPPAQAAATGSVSGTVRNASSTGLGGIWVTVYRASACSSQYIDFTSTSADGSYDFNGLETGSYRIEFEDYHGAYVTQYYNNKPTLEEADDVAVTAGATTSGINATLAVAGHVTGAVGNASGAGLRGIYVVADRPNGAGGWVSASSTSTAADGSYDLGGLPTGSYRVEFRDSSGGYLTQYYNNKLTLEEADDVAVTAGATTSGINATLAAAGHVTGAVRNASGAGLEDILVWARQYDVSGYWLFVDLTRTAADGSYDLGGLETGVYRIEFEDDSGAYAAQYYDNKPTPDAGDDVAVSAGATTSGINATLVPAGHVTGTVKNTSDAGLENISVWAYRANGAGGWVSASSTSTAADGSYDLGGLVTGSYRIEFNDSSGGYLAQYYNNKLTRDAADDVAVTAGATTSGINATLVAAGHISGTVNGASAGPCSVFYVAAYRPSGAGGWVMVNSKSTAPGGIYDLGGLPTGSYRIRFSDSLGAFAAQYYNNKPTPEAADGVAVTAGATTSGINATLGGAGHITGTVKNASGAGLRSIYVAASRANGSGGWDYVNYAYTAAGGSYNLGGLPTGSYHIRFSDSSRAYAAQYYNNKSMLEAAADVAVTAGATTPGINATLVQLSITSFSPTSGPAGTSVILTGSGFTGATAVAFHDTPSKTFRVVSSTQITATVPAGATTGPISVTIAGGIGTSAASFTVTAPATPTITKLTPTAGERGATVTITGSGFGAARVTSSVKFGGKKCTTYMFWSDAQIRCKVPARAAYGLQTTKVATPGGVSNGESFRVDR